MAEQNTNGANLRQHARAPIELKVDYKKLNSFFADYTKNISKGGTFIKTKKPLPIGTRFLFKLTVPLREAPFELLGEVVWSKADGEEPGMGIRFIYTTDTQRSDFEGVVEQLMSDSLGSELAGKLLNKTIKPA
ncbi:MAG: TIGR02266 family protein [Myxococcota bacterium]